MRKVTQYEARDKSLHNTEAAAKQHEAQLTAVEALHKILQPTLTTGRSDSILKHIVQEQEAIRAILLSYNKRIPKAKTAPVATQAKAA